jgi:hypothetical protein
MTMDVHGQAQAMQRRLIAFRHGVFMRVAQLLAYAICMILCVYGAPPYQRDVPARAGSAARRVASADQAAGIRGHRLLQ